MHWKVYVWERHTDATKGKLQVNIPPSAVVRGGEVEVKISYLKYIVRSKGTLHLKLSVDCPNPTILYR